MNNKSRESNFELLRIIAMFLIIMGHMSGQAFDLSNMSMKNSIISIAFGSGSRIAVNLFLMIGIWYMVELDFSGKRFWKLYGSLWFYSVTITFVMIAIGVNVSAKDIISSIIPFMRRWTWFVPLYLTLMLISPILRFILLHLDREKLVKLIIVGGILIFAVCMVSGFMDTYFCAIVWFIYIFYVVAAYKQYFRHELKGRWLYLVVGIFIYSILVAIEILGKYFGGDIWNISNKIVTQWLNDYKSFPNFICSVCIFIFFSRINIGSRKVINFLASNTLDIYLIHQSGAFYNYMWMSIFLTKEWQNSAYFIFYYLIVTIAIYFGGLVIGKIRILIFESLWVKSKLFNLLSQKMDLFYSSFK